MIHPRGHNARSPVSCVHDARIAPGRAARAFAGAALALAAALVSPVPLHAAGNEPGMLSRDVPRRMDIAPGTLKDVLARYAEVAGILLSTTPTLLEGVQSPGLRGSYTVEQGLRTLLAQHGLQAEHSPASGHYVLRRIPDTGARQPRDTVRLDTLEVRGQGETAADLPYQRAGSSHYISREDIDRWRGTSAGDMFSDTPGVLVGENRNSGGLDINIRGMQGQGRVPVVVDGARQETTVYRGYSGATSRSYVDPDLIGNVVIEKGPTAGAEGTGAIGGVVSMRTLSAADIIRDGRDFGLRLRASTLGNTSSPPASGTPGGMFASQQYYDNCRHFDCSDRQLPATFGGANGMDRPGLLSPTSGSASLALAGRGERLEWVAAIARRKTGNYHAGSHGPTPALRVDRVEPQAFHDLVYVSRQGASPYRGGEEVLNTSSDNTSILLKGTVFAGDGHSLELGTMRYESDFGEMMPSIITGGVASPAIAGAGTIQGDLSHSLSNTHTLRYRWQPAGRSWLDLRANLWHTRLRSRITTPDALAYPLNSSQRNERYTRWGMDVSNTARWDSGLGPVSLQAGLTWQQEKLNSSARSLDNLVPRDEVDGRHGTRRESSLFASADWQPLSRLRLSAGLRHTRYRTQDHSALRAMDDPTCFVNCTWSEHPPYQSSGSATTPLASALWNWTPDVQLYLSHARGVRMASLFETTGGFSSSPQLAMRLKPERASNWEAGVNVMRDGLWQPGDRLRMKLAYFHNSTRDYLTRVAAIPNVDSGTFRMTNIDRADFRGVEWSASYETRRWFVRFGGTRYTHVELCHRGDLRTDQFCRDYGIRDSFVSNNIPPTWSAQASGGAWWQERRLLTGARVRYVGSRPSRPANDTTPWFAWPNEWRPYTLVDLFASYRINDRVSLDVNLDNAGDRYYLDALSLGLVPSPGRTLRLGITVSL